MVFIQLLESLHLVRFIFSWGSPLALNFFWKAVLSYFHARGPFCTIAFLVNFYFFLLYIFYIFCIFSHIWSIWKYRDFLGEKRSTVSSADIYFMLEGRSVQFDFWSIFTFFSYKFSTYFAFVSFWLFWKCRDFLGGKRPTVSSADIYSKLYRGLFYRYLYILIFYLFSFEKILSLGDIFIFHIFFSFLVDFYVLS